MRRLVRRGALAWAALLGFLPVFPTASRSQTLTSGQVIGRVTDPSGAAVPGATVVLQDKATGAQRNTSSNAQGQFTFPLVVPGTYSLTVTAPGFEQSVVPTVIVDVAKSANVNVALRIGAVSQQVEVIATPGAELQTLNATVGNTIGGNTLQLLPTLDKSTTSLLPLQPLSTPQQPTGVSSDFGGQVAGARSDQNAFMLDGGDVTNTTSGNSDYYSGFAGGPEGAIPTPVESIEEFKVETNNRTGSFNTSSGAAVMLVTKRGTNQYHGSLYEYHQNAVLNANRWDLNRIGKGRPALVDNRFGGSLGGHFLTGKWKSYFYANYEGRRRPVNVFVTKLVPTGTLKQGILVFRDTADDLIRYNMANSAQCGSSGASPCDPQHTGPNPLVLGMWNKFMPTGNDTALGDGLNTTGFAGSEKYPTNDDFGVVRFDHSFGSKIDWTTSYRYFRELAGSAQQVDIGGIVSGDKLGVPAATSTLPRQPRYLVTGLTIRPTPNTNNDFHFSYLRDWWEWGTVNPFPQVPGTSGTLAPGGDSSSALVPLQLNTGGARNRLWNSHEYGYRDDFSWVRQNHLFQFGGSFTHNWTYFQRDDGQSGSLISLIYYMNNGAGLTFPGSFRPPTCTSSRTTSCLPSNQVSNWNNLYAQTLGIVDTASILRTRDASLQATPAGTLLNNTVRYDQQTLYAQDTYHPFTSLTLTYGLAWGVAYPPVEAQGKQMLTIDAASGNVITPAGYLPLRVSAALRGQVFNPTVGLTPIAKTGLKYPFQPDWHDVGPRVAVAWNPSFKGGVLQKLFGTNQTVLRAGYSRFFDRLNGVQQAIDTLQVVGFANTIECIAPSSAGQCLGIGGSNPANAFRIGVDGATVPLPVFAPSVTAPIIPGQGNIPFAPNNQQLDPSFKPGGNNEYDVTLQRSMPGNGLLEIGYVLHTASGLYQGVDLNQVPYFMTAGGQTFASAFDDLAQEIHTGSGITPQPFFETILKGSSFCTTSCTAGVVSKFGGAITSQQVTSVFNGIQSHFITGPATAAATQMGTFFYYSDAGYSNYNAGFLSYHVRAWRGLQLDANFTYGHSLDTLGINQDVDGAVSDTYFPSYDYGTSVFDRKFNFSLLGLYQMPFHSRNRFLDHLVRGWEVAPIFTAYDGLPLRVLDGSRQEFGQTGFGASAEAIRTGPVSYGGVNGNVAGSGGVGTNGNPARGGTGLNLFANPADAYNAFRPVQVGIDTTSRGGTLRGLGAWNLDMTLARKINFTERASITLSGQFFNIFNHVDFANPSASLQSPQSFGVISTQANNPRQIELGLHLDF